MIHASAETTRARRRRRNRAAILTATLEIVLEHGLDHLTMQRLAERVELSPGALYRYFRGKASLLAELQGGILRRFGAVQDTLLERVEIWAKAQEIAGDARQILRLLAIAQAQRELAVLDSARFRLVAAFLGSPRILLPDDDAAPIVLALGALAGRVAECFEAAAETSVLEPGLSSQRATIFIAAPLGVLQLEKLGRIDPERFQTQRLAEQTALALLRGWGADPLLLAAAEVHLCELTKPGEMLISELVSEEGNA